MDRLLNQHEVSSLAGDFLPRVANVIEAGFQDYVRSMSLLAASGINTNFKVRTSAGMIHDYIQHAAEHEFAEVLNVRVGEFNGIFGILISGKLFIRFKKLKHNLDASNVLTDQSEQFDQQQLHLPGYDDVTLLTAGYIPNPTWTSIQSISLTCRQGDQILWHSDLHREIIQTQMFPTTDDIADDQTTAEVRIKLDKKDQPATSAS